MQKRNEIRPGSLEMFLEELGVVGFTEDFWGRTGTRVITEE